MIFEYFYNRKHRHREHIIASPGLRLMLASVHACTQLNGKRKESTKSNKEIEGPQSKEGSIKTTNSYAPSKVAKEWRKIPLKTTFAVSAC